MEAYKRFGCHFDRLPDQIIVRSAQAGDINASEYLLYKYRGLVRNKIRSYFLLGGERDDLIQVGMIGLWQSIMDYSALKGISFISFARICIERHVITAIKSAGRYKQALLNTAVSLEYFTDEYDSDFTLSEVLLASSDLDPEEALIRREDRRLMREALQSLLSDFEWRVLTQYNMGKSYKEIADQLQCKQKSVDNALGRIKRKVTQSAINRKLMVTTLAS